MAKPIYRYSISKVSLKKMPPLKKGELQAKNLEQIVRKIQRAIKKFVTKKKISLIVKVWGVTNPEETFTKQYDDKWDFKKSTVRKPPKWRQELSRKAKFSRTFDPSPKMWFVQVAKKKQLILTQLAYDPAKKTLLRRKRKKMIGPFPDEASARDFITRVEEKREELFSKRDFKQGRRYKGPMEPDDPTNMGGEGNGETEA